MGRFRGRVSVRGFHIQYVQYKCHYVHGMSPFRCVCYLYMTDLKVHHTCHVETQTENQKNHNQKTSAVREREREREGLHIICMCVMLCVSDLSI